MSVWNTSVCILVIIVIGRLNADSGISEDTDVQSVCGSLHAAHARTIPVDCSSAYLMVKPAAVDDKGGKTWHVGKGHNCDRVREWAISERY